MGASPLRIGIVRLSSFGDIVISASLLRAFIMMLLEHVDEVCIEWFVDDRFIGLLESMDIDSSYKKDSRHARFIIHALPMRSLTSYAALKQLWKKLRSIHTFSLVIDLQGLIKSSIIARILRTNAIIGFSYDSAREGLASWLYTHRVTIPYDSNILMRNFALYQQALLYVGISGFKSLDASAHTAYSLNEYRALQDLYVQESKRINSTKDVAYHASAFASAIEARHIGFDISSARTWLMRHSTSTVASSKDNALDVLDAAIPRILFVLEASIPEKTYPISHFLTLATLMQQEQQDLVICLIYHQHKDMALQLYQQLQARNLRAFVFPLLNFNALKYVLSKMDCVIGGDTGVTHLAWLLHRPTITLLGNKATSSSNNMRATRLARVLLGNPYVATHSTTSSIEHKHIFSIDAIPPESIYTLWKHISP